MYQPGSGSIGKDETKHFVKEEKVVAVEIGLVTPTHYMDEADILGETEATVLGNMNDMMVTANDTDKVEVPGQPTFSGTLFPETAVSVDQNPLSASIPSATHIADYG